MGKKLKKIRFYKNEESKESIEIEKDPRIVKVELKGDILLFIVKWKMELLKMKLSLPLIISKLKF